MLQPDRNPMPRVDLLPHPIKRVGEALGRMLAITRVEFADDYPNWECPLDVPIEPVTELTIPLHKETEMQALRMSAYWQGWEDGHVGTLEGMIHGD